MYTESHNSSKIPRARFLQAQRKPRERKYQKPDTSLYIIEVPFLGIDITVPHLYLLTSRILPPFIKISSYLQTSLE